MIHQALRSVPKGPRDPYFNNTSLLLHFNGVNNSTTITDSSKYNNSVTNVNNVLLKTDYKKFGTSSMYLIRDSSFPPYLSIPISNQFNFGSGDYTIEFWALSLITGYLFDTRNLSNFYHQGFSLQFTQSGSSCGYNFYVQTSSYKGAWVGRSFTLPSDWYHMAFVKSSGYLSIYLNGARLDYVTESFTYDALESPFIIGHDYWKNQYNNNFTGRIDEFRITKGVARYSGSSFTVPDKEFPSK